MECTFPSHSALNKASVHSPIRLCFSPLSKIFLGEFGINDSDQCIAFLNRIMTFLKVPHILIYCIPILGIPTDMYTKHLSATRPTKTCGMGGPGGRPARGGPRTT